MDENTQWVSVQVKKQLQMLMQHPAWAGFETFLADFMQRNFVSNSIKRGTDFDTIWYAAEAEGGKRYIQLLMREMEQAAGEVETS